MPVINFNGATKVILGSEADKAYTGNELVWERLTEQKPFFQDVIERAGDKVSLDLVKISPIKVENIYGSINVIDEEGNSYEVVESYYEASPAGLGLWIKIPEIGLSNYGGTIENGELTMYGNPQTAHIILKLAEPLPETVTKLAIQLEDGSWFGKRP